MILESAWFIFTLALAGFVVALFGWRGRRIDDHPWCRRCRFDLFGLGPDAGACPECGADLGSRRAIRVGQRRRQAIVIGAGAALIIGAVALTGLNTWSRVKRFGWNGIKPDFILAREADSTISTKAAAALDELRRRLNDGHLSEGVIDQLVAQGLEFQGDQARPWLVEWGDFISTAIELGHTSEGETLRYVEQAAQFRVQIVPPTSAIRRVKQGGGLSFAGHVGPIRTGAASSFLIAFEVTDFTINGESQLIEPRSRNLMRLNTIPTTSAGALAIAGGVQVNTPPGRYDVKAIWVYRVYMNGSVAPALLGDGVIEAQIQVLPRNSHEVGRIIEPSLREAVRSCVIIDSITAVRHESGDVELTTELTMSDPPTNLAFSLVLTEGRRAWHGGAFVQPGPDMGDFPVVVKEIIPAVSQFDASDVRITLASNPDAAITTPGVDQVWGEAITFESRPVEWLEAPPTNGQ